MSDVNPLRVRGSFVDALSSALDRGNHGLENVPGLLKRVLEDGSWREFETARGERVTHDRFDSFVASPPLHGLGASVDLIDRIVGTGDPDLLRLLRDAKKGKPGRPRQNQVIGGDSPRIHGGMDTDQAADRLARDAPGEYESVKRGEKTVHAAAIAAGIRRRRMSVRMDSAESAAETLRKHMPPEQLAVLRRLLA